MGMLTMALAAVLVAGSAPAKVSVETRQALDSRGQWDGVLFGGKVCYKVVLVGENLIAYDRSGKPTSQLFRIENEGGGKLKVLAGPFSGPYLGVYHRHGDYVVIAYLTDGQSRSPDPWMKKAGHLILRWVGPSKRPTNRSRRE